MGSKQKYEDDGVNAEEEYYADGNATNATLTDDGAYYQANDDTYTRQYNYNVNYTNDDAAANADDGGNNGGNYYVNQDDGVYYNYAAHDDDFYNMDDDAGRRRVLRRVEVIEASQSATAKDAFEVRGLKTYLEIMFEKLYTINAFHFNQMYRSTMPNFNVICTVA